MPTFFLLVKNEVTKFVGNLIEYPPHLMVVPDAIFFWKTGRRREVQPSDSVSFSLFLTFYVPKTKEVQKLGGVLCLHDEIVARVIFANQ